MASATSTVAKQAPKKAEQRTDILAVLHGVVILCLFALLMLTSDAADNVSRTPQLRSEYYVPYLREVAITLPIFTAAAIILSGVTISRAQLYVPQRPPKPMKEMKWFTIAGVAQLIIAGLLTALTVLQATFLPRPLGQCKNLSQLGETCYLDAIAKVIMSHYNNDEKLKNRGSVCNKMVQNWRFQIANIILLSIAGLLCLHYAVRKGRSGIRARIRFENRVKERGIGMPVTSSVGAGKGCGDVDVEMEMGLAPKAPSAHYKDLASTSMTQSYSTSLSACSPEHYLQRVLGAYDLLSTIATECHYHDIWNLMLVSRGIRAVILGTTTQRSLWKKSLCSHRINQHPQSLFHITNTPGELRSKLIRCFSCGSPMCKECQITSEPLQAETVRHLRDCRPFCGGCFCEKYCFSSRGGKKDVDPRTMLPGKCNCGLEHLKPPREDMPTHHFDKNRTTCYAGSASHGEPAIVSPVEVCKVCKGKPDTEMLGMGGYYAGRRMRTTIQPERSFLPNLSRVEGFKCQLCERDFRRGEVVWWACTWCGKECLEGFHSQMGETIAP